MGEQQSTSRRTVLLAGLAVVVAGAAFAAAFYFLDGATLVTDLIASFRGDSPEAVGRPGSAEPSSTALKLPAGMPESAALRLWQEQIDSQYLLKRLADGEVDRMEVTKVTSTSAEASLSVDVALSDGTDVSGIIGLRRFGDTWYVAFASARRNGVIVRPTNPLPDVDDVDVALLNTILAEQGKSQPVFTEYVAGMVSGVDIGDPKPGPSTVTLDAEMTEDHGEGYAQLVMIEKEVGGSPRWFLARFTKTGHNPPE